MLASFAVVGAVLAGTLPVAGQQPKYGVTATIDKTTDFTKLKTYRWTSNQSIVDQAVDRQIVAAVDRELGALGFTKRTSAPSDVPVSYRWLRRTDVDLKSKPDEKSGLRREYPVGTLTVLLPRPEKRQELFRTRMNAPIELDPTGSEAKVNAAVAEMFAKYPSRTPANR